MKSNWLPPDNIYSGYSIYRMASTPAMERQRMENALKVVNIEPTEENLKKAFEIIKNITELTNKYASDNIKEFRKASPKKVGDVIISDIQFLFITFLVPFLAQLGKNSADSLFDWIKRRRAKKSVSTIDRLFDINKQQAEIVERTILLITKHDPSIQMKIRELKDNLDKKNK